MRGFFASITLDRFDDLRRFTTSLRKYNSEPLIVMVAKDKEDAFRIKCNVAKYSPFDTTLMVDTDMLINGKLDYLFEEAEKGKIIIVPELTFPVWNAGVVVIPKQYLKQITDYVLPLFERRVPIRRKQETGIWEQDFFNEIIDFKFLLLR